MDDNTQRDEVSCQRGSTEAVTGCEGAEVGPVRKTGCFSNVAKRHFIALWLLDKQKLK